MITVRKNNQAKGKAKKKQQKSTVKQRNKSRGSEREEAEKELDKKSGKETEGEKLDTMNQSKSSKSIEGGKEASTSDVEISQHISMEEKGKEVEGERSGGQEDATEGEGKEKSEDQFEEISPARKRDGRRILSPMILRPVIPTPQIMRRLSQGILQEEIIQRKPGAGKSLLSSSASSHHPNRIDLRHHPPPRRRSSTFGTANYDTMSGSLQRSNMYKSEER